MTQQAETGLPISRIALIVAAVAAAFAIGYAISRGSAPQSSEPAATASTQGPQSIEDLAKAAAAKPGDPAAWMRLGTAQFEANLFAEAAGSFEKAVALDGDDASAWSALGEALVMASDRDPMPPRAAQAFEKAIALDAKDPRARYFLAVKKDLGGDHAGALDDWLALLGDTPTDAPWRDDLVRTIEQVGKINKIEVVAKLKAAGAKSPPPPMAAQAIPGPNAQDLAAASQIPPGEQREMAEGMVARLEQRLAGNPRNPDGWVMLIRSRVTLDQPDKAKKALADAVAANPMQAGMLREQAAVLGVK